jgi:beta-glucosidase
MPTKKFPRNFIWGVATAAPQIEGAAVADGKGASVWDHFSRQPGKIRGGHTPAIACDHYHRYRDDIALLARLGVSHYRLSVAWPRIFPDGDGPVNSRGLDFYQRLIDTLLAHRITPWVTLFHWDLPQALEKRGGWRVRATTDAFANYADTVVEALGDRVKHWFTLNEIVCFTRRGYGTGEMAPGTRESEAVINQTYHHALLCHGHAVRAVREHGRRNAKVGLVDNPVISIPVTETAADIAAARSLFIADNIRVLDPVYRGRYASSYLRAAGKARPTVARGDFALIGLPTDFLGLNIYTGLFVRAGKSGQPERLALPASYPTADCGWLKYVPQAIYWGPRFAVEIYGEKSIFITENGVGYEDDGTALRGEVIDLHRRDYLRGYLREVQRAIDDGVPVRGYFLWSFMDNFEWHDGYATRFGIVHINYRTQRRTPKLSASWYTEVMRRNVIV